MKKAKVLRELETARARIAVLERTCEQLTQRVLMAERERDARAVLSIGEPAEELVAMTRERDRLLVELQEACERRDNARHESAQTAFERDRLLGEIEDVRAAGDAALREAAEASLREFAELTDERDATVAALERRVASLVHARERLFDGSVRAADARTRVEVVLAEQLQAVQRAEAERDDVRQMLANARTEYDEALTRFEARSAKAEYERDGARLRLEALTTDFADLRSRSLERDVALEDAERRLAHDAEIVQALSLAHRQAAESLASLELECIRLEYDVASRVGTAETNASRAVLSASRLRDERSLLIQTLALREKRIAVLEQTLREIANEMIRTAEAERERYVALHGGLLASKIVAARNALAALLRGPRALRARVLTGATRASKKRRGPFGRRKRPRHLRSA